MCRGIWPPNFSMQPLSGSALDQVLSLIQSGHNAHEISSATGYHTSTITWIWSVMLCTGMCHMSHPSWPCDTFLAHFG